MIETYFGTAALSSASAMVAALVIGAFFGFALERAGFGSSRKLAGIFYFRDMTVLKVMFTAVITAMLGLAYALGFGWIASDQIYWMPTRYAAQILGGLLFGVGFVVGGWCPGTAAVGMASGKKDAIVFLGGATLGSVLFNEVYPALKGLMAGDEALFVWESLGVSKASFAFAFTLVAVAAFWAAEWAEKTVAGTGPYWNGRFLKAFSTALVFFAVGLFAFADAPASLPASSAAGTTPTVLSETELLETIETAADHVSPETLADRLVAGDPSLLVVDVRPPAEYAAFHIRGAINASLPELPVVLAPHRRRAIVLYSNGMTHPAQARDVLERLGFPEVRHLTDGLTGFVERCLKPVSLRRAPVSPEEAERIRAWRTFFLAAAPSPPAARTAAEGASVPVVGAPTGRPGRVGRDWVEGRLNEKSLRIVDVRPQKDYSRSHLPGSVRLDPENLRGTIGGVGSMLLPPAMLASHFGLLGIAASDTVLLVAGDRTQDATFVGMALRRLGHDDWLVMEGGFAAWTAEGRPVTTALPDVKTVVYGTEKARDEFLMSGSELARKLAEGSVTVLDARPADTFSGREVEEARGGHVPGAISRPYEFDQIQAGGATTLASTEELRRSYEQLLVGRKKELVIMCRTGHQASQSFFVLKDLLGLDGLRWYDGGWTEWAARSEWPAEGSAAR